MIPPSDNPATLFSTLGFVSPPPAQPGMFSILVVGYDDDSVTLRHECLATIAWGGPLPDGWGRDEDVWDWLVHGGRCIGSSFSCNDVLVHIISRVDDDRILAIGIYVGGCESWIATRQKEVAAWMVVRLFQAIRNVQTLQRRVVGAYHVGPSEN